MALQNDIRALLFDVFGTCVDWRSTVTAALIEASQTTITSAPPSIDKSTLETASRLSGDDWGRFAQEWRNTYEAFVRSIASDPTIKFKTVDEHHHDALIQLMKNWNITGLWTSDQITELSLIWHRLDPWADSVQGMKKLNTKYQTCTLSNGNVSLLEDLRVHSGIEFTHLFSGEQVGSYKPNPKVYLGAVAKLGLEPHQCAMVAAHLDDLKAGSSCGLRTIYVERPKEEDFTVDQVQKARDAGYVDLWVTEDEPGFLATAAKLGIDIDS
jgi:2-haloacid dehalogenase